MTWLRTHRWGLIALAVIAPAALLAAMSITWFRYTESRAQDPTPIPSGKPGTYLADRPTPDGADLIEDDPDLAAELTLKSYTVVPWNSGPGSDVGLLEGTEAISAIIHVDARGLPEDTYSCTALLLAPGDGEDRVWHVASTVDIDYYPSGDLEATCDLSDATEFDWEAVFVVPAGVGDDARLIITDAGLLPRYQLQLEH